jgi:recombination protein RecA
MATREVTDKIFNDALKVLSKDIGKGYEARGLADAQYKAIPTGHDDLDTVLTKGAFGIYLGGLIEVFGPEASGKSSLALRICGNAQKIGMKCCWIDAEASFDPNLSIINGCDPGLLVMPDLGDTKAFDDGDGSISFLNVNEILEMIYKSVCQNIYGVIVLDSVAGLMPEAILAQDADPNKSGVGEIARAMSRMLNKIVMACKKTETSVIFINQLRDQIGSYMSNRFHTPGGRAIKFFAQQRIGVEKIGGDGGKVYHEEDGSKQLIGHYARVTIVKNKKAPPLQDGISIEIPIYYREYFPDNAKKCYDLARKLQVITMRNGTLTWKEGETIVAKLDGESSMLAEIRDHGLEPKLARACVEAEQGEKNKGLKSPVKVPTTLVELAASYNPNTPAAKKAEDTKEKVQDAGKRKKPAITL